MPAKGGFYAASGLTDRVVEGLVALIDLLDSRGGELIDDRPFTPGTREAKFFPYEDN
jgi:hypothetical protein